MTDSEPHADNRSGGLHLVDIGLPQRLADLFDQQRPESDSLLVQSIRAGLEGIPSEPQGPANDPDPSTRRKQIVDALLHYSARYWRLSLQIPRLDRQVADLRRELEHLEEANADSADVASG